MMSDAEQAAEAKFSEQFKAMQQKMAGRGGFRSPLLYVEAVLREAIEEGKTPAELARSAVLALAVYDPKYIERYAHRAFEREGIVVEDADAEFIWEHMLKAVLADWLWED